MTKLDDGGPAFPAHPNPHFPTNYTGGMSLRDWFAGQAMASVAAKILSISLSGQADAWRSMGREPDAEVTTCDLIAVTSYDIADAMLAARKGASDGK